MQQYTILQSIGLLSSIGSFIYGLVNQNMLLVLIGSMLGFTFLIMLLVCSKYFDTIKQPLTEVAEQ